MNHCNDTLNHKDTVAMEIITMLQCEQLLVSTEKKHIQALNKKVSSVCCCLIFLISFLYGVFF